MKNIIWVLVVFILAALFVMESRYSLVINSPIVAKIDRITGDVWIANSGLWIKVQHPVKDIGVTQPTESIAKPAANDTAQAKVI